VATEDGELGTPRPSATTRIVGPVAPGAPGIPPPTLPLVPPTGGGTPTVPVVPQTRITVPIVPSAATVTAEIPAVMVSAGRRDDYSDPGWYKERRRTAPYGLRVVVWLLFFILILGLAVIAIERYHPTWLNFARNTATKSHPAALSSPSTTTPAAATPTTLPSDFRELSHTATGAVYSVPAGAYVLIVTTQNPVWTTVNVPPGSKHLVFGETITPKMSPMSVAVSASSSVSFSAQAASVAVKSGGKVVGTITAPTEFPFTYTFRTGST